MSDFTDPTTPSLGHPFTIGVLELDVHLPGCASLKEKRGRLAKLLTHLRNKHPISIAEVGDRDVWGRTGLAAVTISGDHDLVRRILDAVATTVAEDRDVELVWQEIELIRG